MNSIFKFIKNKMNLLNQENSTKVNCHETPIYSQFGEDGLVYKLFISLHIEKPTYLDLGGYHPVVDSNTYLLYKNGSRGVIVEANPDLALLIQNTRTEDKILNLGIVDDENAGSLPFYIMTQKGWSTFSKEHADSAVALNHSEIEQVINIKTLTINQIIAEHCRDMAPDFISIDIENFDFRILKSLNFEKYRPKVICIEASTREETIEFMKNKRYMLWGCTYANYIFLCKEEYKKIAQIHGWPTD
jgi:FkbM family methyltransferase